MCRDFFTSENWRKSIIYKIIVIIIIKKIWEQIRMTMEHFVL